MPTQKELEAWAARLEDEVLTLTKQRNDALKLLDLIHAEWRSDPSSVACFDLHAIVDPTRRMLEEFGDRIYE